MASTVVTVGTSATSLIPEGADPDVPIALTWSGGSTLYVGDRNVTLANPYNPPWNRPIRSTQYLASGETHAVSAAGSVAVTVHYTALELDERYAPASGSDSYMTVVDAGANLSTARPAGAIAVYWMFDSGVDVGTAGANVVNGQVGDQYFVADA